MSMELDELKGAWQRLDQRVQDLTAINRWLVTDAIVRKARWRLAPMVAGAVANVLIGACFAVAAGRFWTAHLDSAPVLISGIAVHVLGVMFIVIGVGRLALARQVDFARPVLDIQRSLASLQRWEAWSFHAAWAGCCALPVAITVSITMAMGPNFWERASGYLLSNLVVWLALAAAPLLLYVISRRSGGRLAARMDAVLTSHSIARARAMLDEIDEFARS
jgi:hypothetical protein